MTRNMGNANRIIRPLIAAVLTAVVLTCQLTGTAIVAAIAAAIFFITSLVGFCPLYRLIGTNTCRRA